MDILLTLSTILLNFINIYSTITKMKKTNNDTQNIKINNTQNNNYTQNINQNNGIAQNGKNNLIGNNNSIIDNSTSNNTTYNNTTYNNTNNASNNSSSSSTSGSGPITFFFYVALAVLFFSVISIMFHKQFGFLLFYFASVFVIFMQYLFFKNLFKVYKNSKKLIPFKIVFYNLFRGFILTLIPLIAILFQNENAKNILIALSDAPVALNPILDKVTQFSFVEIIAFCGYYIIPIFIIIFSYSTFNKNNIKMYVKNTKISTLVIVDIFLLFICFIGLFPFEFSEYIYIPLIEKLKTLIEKLLNG